MRKDEKIQLYRKITKRQSGSTKDFAYRQFIYPESTFISGGLWCSARALKAEEAVSSGFITSNINVQFTINRNSQIKDDLKVIYRGQIYDIDYIDPYDFRSKEMTFAAKQTGDTTNYEGDEYLEN